MKYCTKCGTQLADDAKFCSSCGAAQSVTGNYQYRYNDQPQNRPVTPAVNDSKSFGFALLGFFVPIVGLILYLMWKDETPLRAKSAGKGALVSVIFAVLAIIACAVLFAVAVSMGGTDPSTIVDFGEQFGYDTVPSLAI